MLKKKNGSLDCLSFLLIIHPIDWPYEYSTHLGIGSHYVNQNKPSTERQLSDNLTQRGA